MLTHHPRPPSPGGHPNNHHVIDISRKESQYHEQDQRNCQKPQHGVEEASKKQRRSVWYGPPFVVFCLFFLVRMHSTIDLIVICTEVLPSRWGCQSGCWNSVLFSCWCRCSRLASPVKFEAPITCCYCVLAGIEFLSYQPWTEIAETWILHSPQRGSSNREMMGMWFQNSSFSLKNPMVQGQMKRKLMYSQCLSHTHPAESNTNHPLNPWSFLPWQPNGTAVTRLCTRNSPSISSVSWRLSPLVPPKMQQIASRTLGVHHDKSLLQSTPSPTDQALFLLAFNDSHFLVLFSFQHLQRHPFLANKSPSNRSWAICCWNGLEFHSSQVPCETRRYICVFEWLGSFRVLVSGENPTKRGSKRWRKVPLGLPKCIFSAKQVRRLEFSPNPAEI